MIKKSGLFLLVLFSLSFISAEILILQEPKELYNLGDFVNLNLQIIADEAINNYFEITLICQEFSYPTYRDYIFLEKNQIREIQTIIPLFQENFNQDQRCNIRAKVGNKEKFTSGFLLSNQINLEPEIYLMQTYSPEEIIRVNTRALKRNGEYAVGTYKLTLNFEEESPKVYTNTIGKNGLIEFEYQILKNANSGKASLTLEVFERFNNFTTNKFSNQYNFSILQIPTNLEILLEEFEINSGKDLEYRTNIYDQSGKKIFDLISIYIKNSQGRIIRSFDADSGKIERIFLNNSFSPGNYTFTGKYYHLEFNEIFEVKPTPEIKISFVNQTIKIENIGNVFYNEVVDVKIGEKTFNLQPKLNVGEIRYYSLAAPDGEYEIEVISSQSSLKHTSMLTGNSIRVSESGVSNRNFKLTLAWIFLLIVLGLGIYISFKKGYGKKFKAIFNKKNKNLVKQEKNKIENETNISEKDFKKEAVLSLTIKGKKQECSAVCLRINDLASLEKNPLFKETFEKIKSKAKELKSFLYESQNFFLFIFAPDKTLKLKNQDEAIKLAQYILNDLENYNKKFSSKINYGISLNKGMLVIEKKGEKIEFANIGTFLGDTKRISLKSEGEVLISDIFYKSKLSSIKATRIRNSATPLYKLQGIKVQSKENKQFLKDFVKKNKVN